MSLLDALHSFKVTRQHAPNLPYRRYSPYQNVQYTGAEWFNPIEKLCAAETNIKTTIQKFFAGNYRYVGFKDISWQSRDLGAAANLLEEIYANVKYVALRRDVEAQVKSMQRTWNSKIDYTQQVAQTNDVITQFLLTRKPQKYIEKNISVDANYLDDVYQFLITDPA